MDSHFKYILDELRQMETRLGDRIEGRSYGLEHLFVELVFNAEPYIDEGLVFDDESIYDKGPIFDDEPVFDEESIFDGEPILAEVPVLHAASVFAMEPGDLTTARISAFFSEESGDIDVVFDKELILDEGPLFDKDLVFNVQHRNTTMDVPSRCSTECVSPLLVAPAPVISLQSALMASPSCTMVALNIQSPRTVVPVPLVHDSFGAHQAFDEMHQGIVITTQASMCVLGTALNIFIPVYVIHNAVAQAMKYIEWQPGPSSILLEILHDSAEARPMPWPSFISSYCSMSWDVRLIWKPPWLSVQLQHNIRCVSAIVLLKFLECIMVLPVSRVGWDGILVLSQLNWCVSASALLEFLDCLLVLSGSSSVGCAAISRGASGLIKCMDSRVLEQLWTPNLKVLAIRERVEELQYSTAMFAGVNEYCQQPWPPPVQRMNKHDAEFSKTRSLAVLILLSRAPKVIAAVV